MTTEIVGSPDGSKLRVGIAVATWNQTVTERLLEGALAKCAESGVSDTIVLRVPGAIELPLAAAALLDSGCDAVVAIGTVVRGDTDHYDIVVREASAGLSRVALDKQRPVTHAVLAVHDFEQAMERAVPGPSNKGYEAAEAAITLSHALHTLKERSGFKA